MYTITEKDLDGCGDDDVAAAAAVLPTPLHRMQAKNRAARQRGPRPKFTPPTKRKKILLTWADNPAAAAPADKDVGAIGDKGTMTVHYHIWCMAIPAPVCLEISVQQRRVDRDKDWLTRKRICELVRDAYSPVPPASQCWICGAPLTPTHPINSQSTFDMKITNADQAHIDAWIVFSCVNTAECQCESVAHEWVHVQFIRDLAIRERAHLASQKKGAALTEARHFLNRRDPRLDDLLKLWSTTAPIILPKDVDWIADFGPSGTFQLETTFSSRGNHRFAVTIVFLAGGSTGNGGFQVDATLLSPRLASIPANMYVMPTWTVLNPETVIKGLAFFVTLFSHV